MTYKFMKASLTDLLAADKYLNCPKDKDYNLVTLLTLDFVAP